MNEHPTVKLGSLLVDNTGDLLVCVRVQEDPAFVLVQSNELVDGSITFDIFLLSWILENFSPVIVDGEPFNPTPMDEPEEIGTVVTASSAVVPWVKVADNRWYTSAHAGNPWTWKRIVDQHPFVKVGF